MVEFISIIVLTFALALIVLGIAVVVGVLVENATEDELASTQFLNN